MRQRVVLEIGHDVNVARVGESVTADHTAEVHELIVCRQDAHGEDGEVGAEGSGDPAMGHEVAPVALPPAVIPEGQSTDIVSLPVQRERAAQAPTDLEVAGCDALSELPGLR